MTDVVVQGPALATAQRDLILGRFGSLAAAAATPLRYGSGVRLRGLAAPSASPQQAANEAFDVACVPEGASLSGFGLLAFDMDSTLITIECIDELADLAGIKPRVAAITLRAMRGEIPFAESLRQRVALLGGMPQSVLARVYDERLRLSPGAETLLDTARAEGVATLLVSGGFTWFTDRLRRRLSIDRACANSLELAEGLLTGRLEGEIFDGESKAAAVRDFARELGVPRSRIMVIGDGANDLPMMKEAGVSIAFHAKPAVRAQADYVIDHSGLDAVLNLFPPVG
jgi:phosphoserine phosphatase